MLRSIRIDLSIEQRETGILPVNDLKPAPFGLKSLSHKTIPVLEFPIFPTEMPVKPNCPEFFIDIGRQPDFLPPFRIQPLFDLIEEDPADSPILKLFENGDDPHLAVCLVSHGEPDDLAAPGFGEPATMR